MLYGIIDGLWGHTCRPAQTVDRGLAISLMLNNMHYPPKPLSCVSFPDITLTKHTFLRISQRLAIERKVRQINDKQFWMSKQANSRLKRVCDCWHCRTQKHAGNLTTSHSIHLILSPCAV